MKFRILLWALSRLMKRASRQSPKFQEQIKDKDVVFLLHTLDGKVQRYYHVHNQTVTSSKKSAQAPTFSIGFKDAAFGLATMTAKNKALAFMQGIQDKNIKIEGDTRQVMWFQNLMKYMTPKKKKA
ncbi:helicase [Thiopseudomonas alkaliphila]|uniref:Helicase n=1 Tax=Thiopseudomonas alkaliphila TaxID=1697053 RepID=A0A0K1XF00_9GAMM|nr:helicase [Thiopseudomonas alkaliphila]AKX59742.1 helicase [Thiopseudomonas alkaliphila]MDM1696846.1 helicase [Thiopseudomonas alkaliphila]